MSDIKRKKIKAFPRTDYYLYGWMENPELPDDFITKSTSRRIALIEDEGLEVLDEYKDHLTMIHKAYAALGDSVNYLKYTMKMTAAYLACADSECREIAMLLILIGANPVVGNPNWNKRVKLVEEHKKKMAVKNKER